MKFIYVRIKRNKEPVCLFTYHDQDDEEIFYLVDEICTPHECEYKLFEMDFFGIGWASPLDKEDNAWILDDTTYLANTYSDVHDIIDSTEGWKNITRTGHQNAG